MKPAEQYFVMLCKVVLAFDFVYGIIQCNHSNVNVFALCDGYAVVVIYLLAQCFLVQFFELVY